MEWQILLKERYHRSNAPYQITKTAIQRLHKVRIERLLVRFSLFLLGLGLSTLDGLVLIQVWF